MHDMGVATVPSDHLHTRLVLKQGRLRGDAIAGAHRGVQHKLCTQLAPPNC